MSAVAVRVILRFMVLAHYPASEKLLFVSVQLSKVFHYVHLVALATFREGVRQFWQLLVSLDVPSSVHLTAEGITDS